MEVWDWGTEQCSAMRGGLQGCFMGDLKTGAVGGSRTGLAGLAGLANFGLRVPTEDSVRKRPGQTRALGRKGRWQPGRTPCTVPGPVDAKTQGWGHNTAVTNLNLRPNGTAGQMVGSWACSQMPGLNPAYTSELLCDLGQKLN